MCRDRCVALLAIESERERKFIHSFGTALALAIYSYWARGSEWKQKGEGAGVQACVCEQESIMKLPHFMNRELERVSIEGILLL